MGVNIKARAVRGPEHLLAPITGGRGGGGDYPVPITSQIYKFIEEQARKRGNISVEECFNNLMEEIVMSKMLEDVNPYYRELMRRLDEKVRRWKENGGGASSTRTTYIKNKNKR
jgi:hypothetical protein